VIQYLRDNSADIATFVGMCTFFLTIIISFRVNQAYSRWWEARYE
jgi:predicted membrane chloride channel (bestrophin family)